MAGEDRGEGILEGEAERRGDRTGERPREEASLGVGRVVVVLMVVNCGNVSTVAVAGER